MSIIKYIYINYTNVLKDKKLTIKYYFFIKRGIFNFCNE